MRSPTSSWIVQQLREAFLTNRFPDSCSSIMIRNTAWKYMLVFAHCKSPPYKTSIRNPWQNGVAERWVGSCRRDMLDHIIAVDERHLKGVLSDYVRYYHDDRTHLGLGKQTPGLGLGKQAPGWQTALSGTGFDAFASAARWPAPSLRTCSITVSCSDLVCSQPLVNACTAQREERELRFVDIRPYRFMFYRHL